RTLPERDRWGGRSLRAEALAALAPHLPEDLMAQALGAARMIASDRYRAEALAALAPHLPQDLMAQALVAARKIRDQDHRALALAALAPHLPQDLMAQALDAARKIESAQYRAKALAALAPRLAELPLLELYPLWRETLPALARRTRKDLLADIRALHPVIHKLGGEEAIAETARAIIDVGRWWP
ncbi:MAG: hypothetical protein GXO55_09070, partial [Chloroflexi bacterium]|nr:hypothetical protein [Chloroflexota bacterium]